MPNDLNGAKYRTQLSYSTMHPANRSGLMKALHIIASQLEPEMSTESTAAVGYANRVLYVAKLGRVSAPTNYVEHIQVLLESPRDGDDEETLSVFNDGGSYAVTEVRGVGGGQTGLHAEMMIARALGVSSAWGAEFYYGVGIAANQGACPACAGFLNQKHIWHSGVRANGRVSTKWINPLDNTICGSEIGLGLGFPNQNISAAHRWQADWA